LYYILSFGRDGLVYPKYVTINDNDIELAIREGMHPMTEWFNPAARNLPYFSNTINGDNWGNFHHSCFSAAHVTGRWLEALTAASGAIGASLPIEAIEKLRYWAFSVFNSRLKMPANLDVKTFEQEAVCDLHNLREVMFSFVGLLRINPEDRNAQDMVLHLIRMVNTYVDFETGSWNIKKYRQDTSGDLVCSVCADGEEICFPFSLGRYIGALVRLYKVWPIPEALEQASRLTDVCLRKVLVNGGYDSGIFGNHIHSTTAMLSGVAAYGDLIGNSGILTQVKLFFENSLCEIALDIGWSLENYCRNDLVGEINNSGDLLEACLWLGKAGYAEYFEMADRIIRCHILPAQLLDTCFIIDDPSYDNSRNRMASRMKGAFGFPCPYGHEYEPGAVISFNWDIVGGGVSELCQAWNAKVSHLENMTSVNLLFNHEDEHLLFKGPYNNSGKMEIFLKSPRTIRVLLGDNIRLIEKDLVIPGAFRCIGNWLYLFNPPAEKLIKIPVSFSRYEKNYTFRLHHLRFLFEGNRIIAASSKGKRLCFFPELESFSRN
jgi:hypothetical protein